jgi:hypothetical protein
MLVCASASQQLEALRIFSLSQPFLSEGEPMKSLGSFRMGGGVGLVRLRTPLGMLDLYIAHFTSNDTRS